MRNRLVTLSIAALTAALVAGCDDGGDTTTDAAPTIAVPPSATPVLESSPPPGLDEATKKACGSLDKDIKAETPNGGTQEAAASIGRLIAERGVKAGIAEVIFDRGAYLYHGRVKALAEAAREGGLQF